MSTASAYLRLDAPFAAWRWLQAGVYRGTLPVIPPSAAWGLVLNLAGIESRGPLDEPVTTIRPDAPVLEIAVGLVRDGYRSSVYQQLHSYPVGNSGSDIKGRTHGNKYWIAPVRREFLVGAVVTIAARGDATVIDRIAQGLAGRLPESRYGLPFAGDNQFLFSSIDVVANDFAARWFVPCVPGIKAAESVRLTTNIDRKDASRTEAPLFAPSELGSCPAEAWVRVGPSQS